VHTAYKESNYRRWRVGIILLLGLLGLNILWFVPSPLLTEIMEDLNLSLVQGGLMMSVVCLMIAGFSLVSGYMLEKDKLTSVFSVGLWLMGVGAASTYLVNSFLALFITRIVIGIGFGLCLPAAGSLIMRCFSEGERPYVNTINSILPYIATALTFIFTVPLYLWLGHSWKLVITFLGLFMMLLALSWSMVSKKSGIISGQTMIDNKTKQKTPRNLFRQVIRNKQVVLISIAEAGDMWSFQFLTSYLPTYYISEAGLDLAAASNITAVFPAAGIIAGLACGIWMSRSGLRKPFTWPMHLIIFAGTFMAVNGTGTVRLAGVFLAGFGNAGWAPALFTMPMEFEDMNPARVGAVYAVMLSAGFLAAFVSPWAGGWLGQQIGLHDTIFYFSFSSLIAALCTFMMEETGPGLKRQEILWKES